MAIVPIDNAHAVLALQNDAQQLISFIQWAQRRYKSLNQNLSTTAQQSAAGFTTTADQNAITAIIGDLNRLQQVMTGTVPTTAADMAFDANAILGYL